MMSRENIHDPDEGLELREDFLDELHLSLRETISKDDKLSAEIVATRLGLNW